ncbi:MAG: hypothetical protein EBX41_00745 [Chitinophagia bacterium]|nr:hypothetical protein [Chitinophagia bacterium]
MLFNSAYAQTASWTKFDRDNIYSDVYAYLGTNYKQLTNDQRETISLCFLDEVTSKYTKESYQAKIEIELKRIRNSVIDQCAKNHGVNLTVAPEPKADTPKQAKVWTKKGKDEMFNSWYAYLGKRWKQLTAEQKQTISLCAINELVSKYSYEEYANLMEAEKNKVLDAIQNSCISTNNIDTGVQVVVDNSKPTMANLKGHWKDYEDFSEFWLNDGNSFTMLSGGSRKNGTWSLSGNTLTLSFDRALLGSKERNYKILMYTPDKFVYQSLRSMKATTVERVK